MLISNEKKDINELAVKIIDGVNKALRKLVEESVAKNENLVVGDGATGFKTVPAKELLKTLSKK